ncbi:HRDC domain-containing protein [Desulfosporosinus burensis]
MPRSRKELLQVKGYTEKKVAKYGDEIIRILKG